MDRASDPVGSRRCKCGRLWSSDHAFAAHVRWSPKCGLDPADILDRYVSFEDDGCWIWIGASTPSRSSRNEYGILTHRGRTWRAHRWSYVLIGGKEIPEGYEIDHVCLESLCINPAHLEAVTPEEHQERTIEKWRDAMEELRSTGPDPF